MTTEAAERTLRAALEGDADELLVLVRRRWTPANDPLGTLILLPAGEDEDPVPVDELPWSDVIAAFRTAHGRPPRPGSRALAQRRLTTNPARGGVDG
jgi:hypothetical protein